MEKDSSLIINNNKDIEGDNIVNENNDEINNFGMYEEHNNLSLENQGDRAMNLKYSIGFTSNKIGLIQNLTLGNKKEIFLPAAHTGVIYDYETGEQKLLQGHCNEITACCSVYDEQNKKRWLVTADSGQNSMIVIWDTDTGTNFKNIFKIPTDEIVSMDISKNCNFIATLANKKREYTNEKGETVKEVISQKITLWEWKYKTEQIFISDFFDHDGEIFNLLRFNPNSELGEIELIIQGPSKILFWNINPMNPEACRPYFPIKSKGDKRVVKEKDKEKEKSEKDRESKSKDVHKKEEKDKSSKLSKTREVEYTESTFLNGHSMAITATTAGFVIVWDICEALCKEDEVKTDRRKIKTVQLLKYKKDLFSDKDIIKCLLNYEKYIVIGSGDGAIKFYEYNFIIVRWFENVSWLVTGISFDMGSSFENMMDEYDEDGNKLDMIESGSSTKFKCIPFITTDISASIKRIFDTKGTYIDYNDENIKYLEIYRGIESNVVSMAIHPKLPLIAITTDGVNNEFKKEKKKKESIIREKKFEFRPYVQIFPFPDHMKYIKEENKMKEDEKMRRRNESNLINKKQKEDTYSGNANIDDIKKECNYKIYLDVIPTVVEFSNNGEFLLVGTSDARILFYDSNDLSKVASPPLQIKDITDKDHLNERTVDIVFSPDNKHFAATDTFCRIGLFRYGSPYSTNENEKKEWTLVGRYQFEVGAGITSFTFNDSGNKIYCCTEDKYLHEFELNSTSKYEANKLPLPKSNKIENDGDINCIVMSPLHSGGKDHIIMANSEYKLRLVGTVPSNITSDHYFLVKQTSLGPTYGKPINKLRIVPGLDKDKRLIAFSTEQKIFGLLYLPIDGNPYRMMGVIGHPRQIKEIRTSKNLDYIFTTGGNDYVINVWKHNIHPLIDSVQSGGDGIEPHLTLLEGGRDGLMYQEMVNFFYYTQIKSRDENTTKPRTLGDYVDKIYIHGLMAAMGFYPSQADLNYMYNEIKYSRSETEKYDKSLENNFSFDMFVKLYINHRPYKDLEYEKFNKAFEKIRKFLDPNSNGIAKDKLMELLKEYGDKMEEKQISECLEILTGDVKMKDNITADYFYHDVLKFDEEATAEEETTEQP